MIKTSGKTKPGFKKKIQRHSLDSEMSSFIRRKNVRVFQENRSFEEKQFENQLLSGSLDTKARRNYYLPSKRGVISKSITPTPITMTTRNMLYKINTLEKITVEKKLQDKLCALKTIQSENDILAIYKKKNQDKEKDKSACSNDEGEESEEQLFKKRSRIVNNSQAIDSNSKNLRKFVFNSSSLSENVQENMNTPKNNEGVNNQTNNNQPKNKNKHEQGQGQEQEQEQKSKKKKKTKRSKSFGFSRNSSSSGNSTNTKIRRTKSNKLTELKVKKTKSNSIDNQNYQKASKMKKPNSSELSKLYTLKMDNNTEKTKKYNRIIPLPIKVTKVLNSIRSKDKKKSWSLGRRKKKNSKGQNKKNNRYKKSDWKIQISNEELNLLLIDPKMEIFDFLSNKILQIPAREPVAKCIFQIFHTDSLSLEILKFTLYYEINDTDYGKNLFRTNSMATKLLSVFRDYYGKVYLTNILKGPVKLILEDKSDMEINPTKIIGEVNEIKLKKNRSRLLDYAKIFFKEIFSSVKKCPFIIREICRYIRMITKKKFPEMELCSVGAFVFLRFICPAITSPQLFEIVGMQTTIPMEKKRYLMYITKIIQVISNNAIFSQASCMHHFNEYVTKPDTLESLFRFLDEISSPLFEEDHNSTINCCVTKEEHSNSLSTIKTILENYLPDFKSGFEIIRDKILSNDLNKD
ncbi:ras gtpase-activating protein [Anaeramoeba flamelloides]|uniref:Ras gtpase-activating protein n=1 Tax=Anaeramoeba flamelloides TaxID=1746091 RepID=A0ABQ8XMW9_9EUKA|nr:ras gtpase-activating protein [Anaeramoeba flamelloides]